MLFRSIFSAICLAVIVFVSSYGISCANESNEECSSVPYDRSGLIRDLNIGNPDRNPYMTLDEWLQDAPIPPKNISQQRRDAFYRAWATLWINTQPAEGAWIRPIISPGQRYMRGIWLWDAAFHVMGLAHGGPKARQLGLWQIEVMLSAQEESGKIPREIWQEGPRAFGVHGIQSPGILTLAANRLFRAADSDEERALVRDAIEGFYSQLIKNHEWFWANTQTHSGLCTWTSVDSWDTSPRWDNDVSAAVDLNSWLYIDRIELANMARILGKSDDVRHWHTAARELRDIIRAHHWNESLGVYNDLLGDRSVSDSITPVVFWPIWAGVATFNQAEDTAKYLDDPEVFDTEWPLPSIAVSDIAFDRQDYWRGPVWVNLNWVAIRGLQRYGYDDAADALREKTVDLIARTPILYEYYDPVTGAGLGSPQYGWTAALYIDLILDP